MVRHRQETGPMLGSGWVGDWVGEGRTKCRVRSDPPSLKLWRTDQRSVGRGHSMWEGCCGISRRRGSRAWSVGRGVPCQPFSKAGKRLGSLDKHDFSPKPSAWWSNAAPRSPWGRPFVAVVDGSAYKKCAATNSLGTAGRGANFSITKSDHISRFITHSTF